MSYSDVYTEQQLHKLEQRIIKEYQKAAVDLSNKANKHFERYQKQFEVYRKKVIDGEMTKRDFQAWQRQMLMVGERWENLRDTMAQRVVESNKVAVAYINDTTPSIFSLNQNFEQMQMERVYNVTFSAVDEQTVRRLIQENPHVLPPYTVDSAKSLAWNRNKIGSVLLQGILQGQTIPELAKNFHKVAGMNKSNAIRNARTAVTSAQNGGRQASYERAAEMGIIAKKRWLATRDGRTRDSHRWLDGDTIPYNETFANGCKFPADPEGRPEEVYNCRCTLVAEDLQYYKAPTKPEYLEWARKKING